MREKTGTPLEHLPCRGGSRRGGRGGGGGITACDTKFPTYHFFIKKTDVNNDSNLKSVGGHGGYFAMVGGGGGGIGPTFKDLGGTCRCFSSRGHCQGSWVMWTVSLSDLKWSRSWWSKMVRNGPSALLPGSTSRTSCSWAEVTWDITSGTYVCNPQTAWSMTCLYICHMFLKLHSI